MSLIFNLILVPVPILSEPLVLLDPLVEDARAWDNAWTETIFGNGTPPFKTIVYSSPQVIWNSTHWVKYEIKSINETTIILRTPSCAYLVGELVVSLLASNEAIDVGGMEWIVEQYSEKLNQWLPKTVETASVSYNSTHVWQKWTFSDGSERVLYIGHDNKQTFSFTSKISATYRVAWHFIDVNATRTIYSSGNETRLNKGSEFSLTDFNFTRLILYNENGYSLLVDYNDIDQSYYRNLVFGSSETGLAYTNLICGNWTTNPDETITIDPFTKTFLSEDNLDGILFKWGFSYPPTDIYGPYQEFGTGQNRIGDMFLIYRGYASFDTSDIRDYSVITDATLKLKTLGLDTVLYDFDVRVMGGSQPLYGSSLETADWDCGTTEVATWSTSDYPGDDIYINITIPTDQVNVEGRTQFELKSDREGTPPTHAEIIAFYDGCVAGSEPKLEITWLPNSISVDGQTWYYWNSTTNEKAAIVLFGGYYYDVPDINWINVGSLFYRDLFIQDPWPYHKEKFVVDLHSNGFDVLSPKDDTYQEELSYYDATSDWVKDASMWLTEKGYDSIFLFGFSAGGVVAAYEIQKDYASIFSAAVVANAPVDNDEYGDIFNSADTASQVKVCTSFIASENDIPIIEQMENYYDNTTVHKEWHLWEGGHDPFPNNCLDHPTETVFDVTYKWWKDHIPLTSYLDEGAPRPGWWEASTFRLTMLVTSWPLMEGEPPTTIYHSGRVRTVA